jgi:hypothetical protein
MYDGSNVKGRPKGVSVNGATGPCRGGPTSAIGHAAFDRTGLVELLNGRWFSTAVLRECSDKRVAVYSLKAPAVHGATRRVLGRADLSRCSTVRDGNSAAGTSGAVTRFVAKSIAIR